MGMMVGEGTDVLGTGASTVRTPSTESTEAILVTSISAGSLKTTRTRFQRLGAYNVQAVTTGDLPSYLYFLVKHLAMNPCSSGLSSCFPAEGKNEREVYLENAGIKALDGRHYQHLGRNFPVYRSN